MEMAICFGKMVRDISYMIFEVILRGGAKISDLDRGFR